MANLKNITLDEVRINSNFLDDALSAVLQTILFVRSSTAVKPKDHACQSLSPLVYAKCGTKEVDQSIETSIDAFKRSLVPHGGCMKGEVLLSFFDKREVKEYLGFVTRSENVCFEKWGISVVVLDATVGDGIASTNAAMDKAEAYRSAYDQITNTIMSILVAANTGTDHIPASQYEYEILVNAPTPCGAGNNNNFGAGNMNSGSANSDVYSGSQDDRRRRSTGGASNRPLNPYELQQNSYR